MGRPDAVGVVGTEVGVIGTGADDPAAGGPAASATSPSTPHGGVERAGVPVPRVLAVTVLTVLTSDDSAPPHILPKRVETAADGGCDGLVCAVADVAEARRMVPGLFMVTTGIRVAGDEIHDHRRAATPGEAFAAGADLLVLGRTITHAPDPAGAAAALVDDALS